MPILELYDIRRLQRVAAADGDLGRRYGGSGGGGVAAAKVAPATHGGRAFLSVGEIPY